MMEFLKIKVYRRKFLLYFFALLLLCVLLCWFVCRSIMDSRLESFQSQTQNAFLELEGDIESTIQDIESFIVNVYATPPLLQDFQCFYGKTSEEYQTRRLDGSGTGGELVSFVDEVRAFATKGNRRLFSHISFHPQNPEESINVIVFYEETSTIQYGIAGNDPLFAQGIDKGLTYMRKLVSPTDRSEEYGYIVFTMRSDWLFSGLKQDAFENAAIIDTNGVSYTIKGSAKQALEMYRQSHNGNRKKDLFNENQAESFVSNYMNGSRLITTTSTWSLMFHNNIIFFIIVGTFVLFVCMMLLLTLTLRQDARFLSRIIGTIDHAKSGEFTAIDTKHYRNNNEYGLIARELNDMSGQLEAYIRTEYILKIKQKEAEMIALQNQINPHFLFNTLEIIRSMAVVQNAGDVADAVAKLGKMYRDIVKNDPIIPMEKEVELLNNYLAIMEFRSNGNFYYQIKIDPGMRRLQTVKFWMQPLAENFFKHGYDPGAEFNLLIVDGRDEEDYYSIEITDNGKGIDEKKLIDINAGLDVSEDIVSNNIGINNVYQRLRNFYGDAFRMGISNNDESGISIEIRIGKNREEGKHGV